MSVDNVDIVIPSSPSDRKEILDAIKEMSNSKTRIDSENAYIKETIKDLEKKFDIKSKYFRKMLADYHKDQFDQKVAESDAYSELYEMIIGV